MLRWTVGEGSAGQRAIIASHPRSEKSIAMSWKSISKISRNSAPKKAEAEYVLQSMRPQSQAPARPESQEAAPEKDDRKYSLETVEALKQQYLEGRPWDQILAESGVARATLFRWRKEGKWDEEKNKKAILAQKLLESLAFYDDPNNTEQAIAESNVKLLLRIQGVNLSKLMHRALSGEAPDIIALGMSDALNKYSSMLEKLIKSDQSIKSGGVERKEVVHVHQLDMDDALKLALEMKKTGQMITVQEAMALLQAQQSAKKAKADEHHG